VRSRGTSSRPRRARVVAPRVPCRSRSFRRPLTGVELGGRDRQKAKDVRWTASSASPATRSPTTLGAGRHERDKNPPSSPFYWNWLSQKCFDGSCPWPMDRAGE